MLDKGKTIKFSNGKKLGVICKDMVFRIYGRDEKKHLFRIYNGWALNRELLKDLKDIGVEIIEIHTKQNNIYKTNILNFFNMEKAILYKNPRGERDIQLVLPLEFWFKKKKHGDKGSEPIPNKKEPNNTLNKYISKR